jgi:cytochrome c biogenesis protein CcmG, thiol:disulfide interchange protein DsbE
MLKFIFKMIYFVPLLLLMAISLFLWRGLDIDPKKLPSTLMDKKVPSFSLPTLNNAQQSMTDKDLQGHLSLVHVWASWCETCQSERGILDKIAQTKNLSLYGIDYKDQRKDALVWLNKGKKIFKKIGFDQKGIVSIDWGVYGTPETYLIDSKGIVRYKHVGEITWDLWKAEILPKIKELQT